MAFVARSSGISEVVHQNHDWAAINAYEALSLGSKYTQTGALVIPSQNHMLIDSLKEETRTANVDSLINRFAVICRFCLNDSECLLDIFFSNDSASAVAVMAESLASVKIEVDDMLPKRICTSCYKLLNQCIEYKHQVVSADTALRRCIDQSKEFENQNQGIENSESNVDEQHILDDLSTPNQLCDVYKYEDLIDEEYTPGNEIFSATEANSHSDIEEKPVGNKVASDFSAEVKSEPIINPSDVAESSPNVKLKCEQCEKEFSCKSVLKRHILLHAKKKLQYECSVCSKNFSYQTELNAHLSSHQSRMEVLKEQTNALNCEKCNTCFTIESKLYIHASHPEDGKILCRQCDRDSSKRLNLRSQVKSHYKVKPLRLHTSGNPFVCNVCGKSFRMKRNLEHHLRLHSGDKKSKCPQCPKSFDRPSKLAIHFRTHTGEKPYKCSHCSKSYSSSSSLGVHVRKHTGEKRLKCPHCSKSFGSYSNMIVHVSRHTGENPYKCSQCSNSFDRPSRLARHVRTHTGEKPFICNVCNKSFSQKGNLIIHRRMHSNERPFSCSHCSKSFRQSTKLAIHVRKHTGEM